MVVLLELLARVLAPLEPVVQALAAQGGGPASAALAVSLLGAASVLVATGLGRTLLALCGLVPTSVRRVLREGADLRLLVFARDPDADGHVRSRAPGRALPAA
jgi:hypothetical protein